MPATVGCARDDNDESRRRRGADLVDNSVNYGVVVSGRCLVWIHLHWDGTGGGGGSFGARGSMKWNVELWIGISSGLLCLSVCCVAAYVRALSRPITCDGAVAETVSEVEVGGGGEKFFGFTVSEDALGSCCGAIEWWWGLGCCWLTTLRGLTQQQCNKAQIIPYVCSKNGPEST